jgi:hypothetical protein
MHSSRELDARHFDRLGLERATRPRLGRSLVRREGECVLLVA